MRGWSLVIAFAGLVVLNCGGSGGLPGTGGRGGGAGHGGSGGHGGNAGQGGAGGNACGCTTGCCRSDSKCGVVVGNLLGPCVLIVPGTPDDNCPGWVGGEINLGGCCLSDGMCGIAISPTNCFAGSEVGLPPMPCP